MRERVTGWNWYWVCLASWLSMVGAWAAAAAVLGRPDYTLRTGTILVAAFPFAYYLRFTKTSRLKTNLIVLAAAVLLGLLEVRTSWMPVLGEMAGSLGGSYQALIALFVWVMVFRAFTIRSERDAAETILAVGSILVLVLVSLPNLIAVTASALSLLGAVAVLAANHEANWTPLRTKLRSFARVRPPTRRTANSWMTLYVFGLLCAIVASQGIKSIDITERLGRAIQIHIARMMLRASMQEYTRDVSADPRLYIFKPGPNGNTPLFEVETDNPMKWRLATYSKYDGGWWTEDMRRIRPGKYIGPNTWKMPIRPGCGKGLNGDHTTFTVTALLPIGGAAPAVFWPEKVTMPRASPKIDAAGALWTRGYLRPGESYTVTATLPDEGHEPRTLSPELRAMALELPKELPQRVRKLAHELTDNVKSPLRKVAMLQAYLQRTCKYDLDPPVPDRPWGHDFVDYFIFDSHRGHCVYFASALVVMARCIGLPARLVSGFLEGDLQEDGQTYLVRAKDAHAWAEVFIPGYGWKEFDPTPGRPPTPSEIAAQTWDRAVSAISREISKAAVWVGIHLGPELLLLACFFAGILGVRRWRWARLLRVRLADAAPGAQVKWAYNQMLRWLAEAGVPKPFPMTPLEHARALDEQWDAVRHQAVDLSYRYYKSAYSAGGAGARDARLAVQDAEMVRNHWLALRLARRKRKAERPGPK